jgi:transcriptional regulator
VYTPKAFAPRDEETSLRLIEAHPLATLALSTRPPQVAPLPFALDRQGRRLLGHVARANPVWRSLDPREPVLALFQGPDTYVSPRWYVTADQVPTWNYAVVHVEGRPRVLDDPAEAAHVLASIVDRFERDLERPWSAAELSPGLLEELLRAIVVFEITIDRVEGKLKLSQNRDPGDREAVRRALRARGSDADREMLALMDDGEVHPG